MAASGDSLSVVTDEEEDDVDVHVDVEPPILSSRILGLPLLILRVCCSSADNNKANTIFQSIKSISILKAK